LQSELPVYLSTPHGGSWANRRSGRNGFVGH
jgi:hypothetical protein